MVLRAQLDLAWHLVGCPLAVTWSSPGPVVQNKPATPFPFAFNSQGWAGPKPETWVSRWPSHVAGQGVLSIHLLPCRVQWETGLEGEWPSVRTRAIACCACHMRF